MSGLPWSAQAGWAARTAPEPSGTFSSFLAASSSFDDGVEPGETKRINSSTSLGQFAPADFDDG
jgi:hypothetical protein